MNKLSKEKKQQLIGVAVGTVGAMAAIYFLMISAQLDEVAKTKTETEATRLKVGKADDMVKKADDKEKELKARTKQLGLIEEHMASGDLAEWILNTLKQVKIPHPGVTIAKVSSEESIKVGVLPVFPYDAVRFVVRGSGYYHDLGKFFTDFENSMPYFRIQNLELEPGDQGLSTNKLHEILAFKADFVVLLKPNPAPAPSPTPKK